MLTKCSEFMYSNSSYLGATFELYLVMCDPVLVIIILIVVAVTTTSSMY